MEQKENLQTQVTITVAAPISVRHGNAQALPPSKAKLPTRRHVGSAGAVFRANSRWQPLVV
jgi:hypothetical protein